MLRKGQRFPLDGKSWRVVYVNPCRAHCRCESQRVVTVTDKHGRSRTFQATVSATLDISPNTDLDLLRELAHPGHFGN